MNHLKKISRFLAVGILLSACAQDPGSLDHLIKEKPPAEPPKTVPTYLPRPMIILEAPELVEFQEGIEDVVELRVKVPEGGTPNVKIDGLPKGAELDPVTFKIKWTPDFEQGSDPLEPTVNQKAFPLKIHLWDTRDPKVEVERKCLFIVHDSLRDLNVKFPKEISVKEGAKLDEEITISSLDFPNGPFKVQVEGAPLGLEVKDVPGKPNTKRLTLNPLSDYTTVHNGVAKYIYPHGYILAREFLGLKIVAVAPRGVAVATTDLRVIDSREFPHVSLPENLEQGLDATFTVTATDSNREVAPEISLYNKPSFGKIITTPVKITQTAGDVFTSALAVRWTEIPPEQIGQSAKATFRICNFDRYKSLRNCDNKSVTVTFKVTQHAKPLVDRTTWPATEIQVLKEGESLEKKITVTDAETTSASVNVEILPEAMKSQVTWKNNRLTVKPSAVGQTSFFIQATSRFGAIQIENFSFEVVPKDWPSKLILVDATLTPEVQGLISMVPSHQLANPALEGTSSKLFLKRDTVYLTTSLLQHKADILTGIATPVAAIDKVVFSSPLLEKLPTVLLDGLKSRGVKFKGRFATLTGAPPLKEFTIQPAGGSGLKAPTKPILLSETISSESSSPMALEMETTSSCKPLLVLRHATAGDYLVAVKCGEGAKSWVVAGFEWAALTPDASEQTISQEWLQTVTK